MNVLNPIMEVRCIYNNDNASEWLVFKSMHWLGGYLLPIDHMGPIKRYEVRLIGYGEEPTGSEGNSVALR